MTIFQSKPTTPRVSSTGRSLCGSVGTAIIQGVVLWLGTIQSVSADWIWMRGQSQPRSGLILERSADGIQFIPHRGATVEPAEPETIAGDQIVRMIATIDQGRLSELNLAQGMDYLEMGDELALAPDPAAKELAIRLYVLAAANSQGPSRLRAIRSMLSLARNDEEKQRCRMLLAFWGDPATSTAGWSLKPKESAAAELTDGQATLADLHNVLELLRREDFEAAKAAMAAQPTLQQRADQFSPQFDWQTLQQWSAQSYLLTIDLYQLLGWQREIESRLGNSERAVYADDWSHTAKQPWRPRRPVPTLETLTEFDPRATQFHRGQWTIPKDSDR